MHDEELLQINEGFMQSRNNDITDRKWPIFWREQYKYCTQLCPFADFHVHKRVYLLYSVLFMLFIKDTQQVLYGLKVLEMKKKTFLEPSSIASLTKLSIKPVRGNCFLAKKRLTCNTIKSVLAKRRPFPFILNTWQEWNDGAVFHWDLEHRHKKSKNVLCSWAKYFLEQLDIIWCWK